MSCVAFLNGRLIPFEDAKVPITDRGFTFGDGVYEVTAVLDGRLVDNLAHLTRLFRSLAELSIPNPYSREQWTVLQRELIAENDLDQGVVYLQVTRGASERDFAVPSPALLPTTVMFTQVKDIVGSINARNGVRAVTTAEFRWQRRDIKSIALTAAVMAKRFAADEGAQEVWFHEDGVLTEGGSSNIFMVPAGGALVTRPVSNALLGGITRQSVLEIARSLDLTVEERAFALEEVNSAREAFTTSASTFLVPVISVDGHPIADGKPGPVTQKLQALYVELARSGGLP
ncbi:D-amino-acid transaminase [Devosia sp.]|uniref:D-amino-acid transaminase n=1 Tax=Devosia sp. TaxID=1871048 RepID=UPI0019FB9774|nr:D-amino-acid transaminase [Devosia sp.]MBE0578766.1 D-amino-acid transaminase [Devosia sp.]